jgi:hypothetical protein
MNDAMTTLLFLFALQLWPTAPRSAIERRLETWPGDYVAAAKA